MLPLHCSNHHRTDGGKRVGQRTRQFVCCYSYACVKVSGWNKFIKFDPDWTYFNKSPIVARIRNVAVHTQTQIVASNTKTRLLDSLYCESSEYRVRGTMKGGESVHSSGIPLTKETCKTLKNSSNRHEKANARRYTTTMTVATITAVYYCYSSSLGWAKLTSGLISVRLLSYSNRDVVFDGGNRRIEADGNVICRRVSGPFLFASSCSCCLYL